MFVIITHIFYIFNLNVILTLNFIIYYIISLSIFRSIKILRTIRFKKHLPLLASFMMFLNIGLFRPEMADVSLWFRMLLSVCRCLL